MVNICLSDMTKSLCRTYLQNFAHDPDLFMDGQPFTEYVYSQEKADTYWQRHQDLKRIHLAIMQDGEPIGEIILKNIDCEQKICTFGISLQNDAVKNQGIGTAAERLLLQYAFNQLEMKTVFADALIKNHRSRHVLEKVGFKQTHQDGAFSYYRCDRKTWQPL